MMREQAVPRLLVPRRHLQARRRRQDRQLLPTLRQRRNRLHRRRRTDQHPAAAAEPRKTCVEINPRRTRVLQLRKIAVQQIDRVAVDLRRVRIRVDRQKIGPPVLQARHAVPRIEHHHVRTPPAVQVTPQMARVAALVAERRLHLRLARVTQVDDVLRAIAEHIQNVAPERLRVPVRVFHVPHQLVRVVLVAHDHRHAMRIPRMGALNDAPCQKECQQPAHSPFPERSAAMLRNGVPRESRPAHPCRSSSPKPITGQTARATAAPVPGIPSAACRSPTDPAPGIPPRPGTAPPGAPTAVPAIWPRPELTWAPRSPPPARADTRAARSRGGTPFRASFTGRATLSCFR